MVEDEDGEWVLVGDVPSVEGLILEQMGYQEDMYTCGACNHSRARGDSSVGCLFNPSFEIQVSPQQGRCDNFEIGSAVAPAPAVVGGPDVDSTGRPWDRRIDARSKKVNQFDGKWRPKRDVPREKRALVLAEYITPAVEND
jgi:hypothetical protein